VGGRRSYRPLNNLSSHHHLRCRVMMSQPSMVTEARAKACGPQCGLAEATAFARGQGTRNEAMKQKLEPLAITL
jgi:hypothetical protein